LSRPVGGGCELALPTGHFWLSLAKCAFLSSASLLASFSALVSKIKVLFPACLALLLVSSTLPLAKIIYVLHCAGFPELIRASPAAKSQLAYCQLSVVLAAAGKYDAHAHSHALTSQLLLTQGHICARATYWR